MKSILGILISAIVLSSTSWARSYYLVSCHSERKSVPFVALQATGGLLCFPRLTYFDPALESVSQRQVEIKNRKEIGPKAVSPGTRHFFYNGCAPMKIDFKSDTDIYQFPIDPQNSSAGIIRFYEKKNSARAGRTAGWTDFEAAVEVDKQTFQLKCTGSESI